MRDKIIELYNRWDTGDLVELTVDGFVSEILALFSINPPHDCSGDDCITCRNMRVSIGWNAERLSDQIVSLRDFSAQPDGFPVEDY